MAPAHRILVVDDETIITAFLKRLLHAGNGRYDIRTAVYGEQAVAQAASFLPHLIVLDINIPGLDGFEVCRQIRNDPNAAHTVILAMTSEVTPERLVAITQAGAAECLSKPFPLGDFLAKVRHYLATSLEAESLAGLAPQA